MKRSDRDSESDHDNHDDPAFQVEKGERAMLTVFTGDPLGMLIKQPFEYKIEEQQEDNCRLADLEQPVLGVANPGRNPDPKDIRARKYPYTSGRI